MKSFNFQKLGKISGKGAYKPEIKLAGASRITRQYLGVMFQADGQRDDKF